jgi:rhamnogalacturonan acetylesterase
MKLYITGDSTTSNQAADKSLVSWGEVFSGQFDENKVQIVNAALSGHSIRDYVNRGEWRKVMNQVKKGDILLSCHGHLERAPLIKKSRGSRGSLRGDSNKFAVVIDPFYQRKEIVHTFGWYVRKYIADCKSHGVELILLSPPVRNIWENGRVRRGGSLEYVRLTKKIAQENNVHFFDAGRAIASAFNALGQQQVAKFFGNDNLHTNQFGAEFIAEIIFTNLLVRFPSLFRNMNREPLAGSEKIAKRQFARKPLAKTDPSPPQSNLIGFKKSKAKILRHYVT